MVTRTEGPFEYWEVTGEAVRSAAEKPGTDARVIESLAGELENDETRAAQAIEGDIEAGVKANTTAAKDVARGLAAKGAYAVGLLGRFGDYVDKFDDSVNLINIDYKTMRQARIDAKKQSPKVQNGDEDVDYAGIGSAVHAELVPRYQKAESIIDDDADTIAKMFKDGPTDKNVRDLITAGLIPLASAGLYPTLTLTADDKQEALESELARNLRGLTPAQQAQYIKDHQDLDPRAAGAIPPEVQKILADEVAGDLKDKKVDAETVRLMNLMHDQPPFAHGVYSQVSPEQLADAIKDMNEDVYPNGYMSDHADDDKEKFYREFLTAAGTTFATYTKGSDEYPPEDNLTDKWFDAITDDDHDGQGAALTLLLRAGGQESTFDTSFLSDLTGRVYTWEERQDGPVWSPMDDHRVVNPFLTNDDHYRYATDGLANLLGAMEKSPHAAQDFFNDGYPDGDTSKQNNRLEYLLTGRTFSSDHSSDEGEGLGAALEAAATGDREHVQTGKDGPYRDEWSADFTSDVFNLIAEHSGDGDAGKIGPVNLPDDVWHTWPGLADNLGNIGASYSSDIYDIVHGAPAPGAAHLDVKLADMDKIFGEIGRGDKSGIETLTAGIMLEGNHRLDLAITQWQAKHPGEPIDLENLAENSLGEALRGRGGTNGEVLGHIINQAIKVDEHDMSLAETRAAYVSKAIDITGGFIPGAGTVLGEGASELSKSAFDVAKGEGLDLLKKAVDGTGDATGEEYSHRERSDVSRALEYNTMNRFLANHVIEEGNGTGQIPSSLLTDGPGGTRVLNPDLYDADGTDTIGKKGEYSDAQIRDMKEGLYNWSRDISSSYAESVVQPAQDGLDREMNK